MVHKRYIWIIMWHSSNKLFHKGKCSIIYLSIHTILYMEVASPQVVDHNPKWYVKRTHLCCCHTQTAKHLYTRGHCSIKYKSSLYTEIVHRIIRTFHSYIHILPRFFWFRSTDSNILTS